MNPWLNAFLNSFVFMIVGAIMVYVGLCMVFPKRRSAVGFAAYMMLKGLLWSWYDASYVLGTLGPLENSFQLVGTPILGVLSYVVIYYTWKGDFYKIGLGGFVLDIFTIVAMTPVFVLADGPFPMMASYEYRGYLGLGGFIRCLGMSALYLVLLFLARPLFKWFSSYEFVHKNIWQTIAVVGIVAVSLPRMTTNTLATQPVLSAIWLGVLLFIPFVVYFVSRVRVERKRKALLESEVALTEEYARFILEQIEYLERSAVQLDEVASDIAHVQEEIESAFLKKQVAELKDLCNQLRHGSFSDNPALDVVLATYEEEFAKEGLQIDYRVRPLGDAATQAALVAQAMLAWTLGSCKAAMGRDGASRESGRDGVTVGEDGADVEFRIIREGDQLVFMLDAPSNRRRRFSRHILEERVPSFDGMFTEADDGARKTVRALVSMA